MKQTSYAVLALLTLMTVLPHSTQAQESDRDAVYAALQDFFVGFAEQDSTKMFQYMERGGRLVLTSNGPDGQPMMRVFPVEDFINALMRPRPQPVREDIFNPEIRVVDNLAAAWVDYNVWVGDQIDHCGVDHFQLFRSSNGWKIIATADTQRRTGCTPSQ